MTSEKPGHVSALLTDLYELTMAASYFEEKMFAPASFSLFIRGYPKDWGYYVNAGLDDVLNYLEDFHFAGSDIEYLKTTGLFSNAFLEFLAGVRFTGDVWALKEGEVFFADEPIMEITAPIIEGQIVETFIINSAHLQSLICTKASRCMEAAAGRALVDFSLRRTHGVDAGLKVARSSYIAGLRATSNVLAGQLYGIPITGTMAHSYITAFEDEKEAFRAFARAHPENTVLLIDTYDTLSGAKNACEIGREMKAQGLELRGVRLDSGDMAELSKQVRAMLDKAGLEDTLIFASSGFDEYKIADVLASGAKIDGFGVGTNMGVSKDAPTTDMAYKLVEYDGRPLLKLSADKVTLPGEKQVFRYCDSDSRLERDTIALRNERPPSDSSPLLVKVMEGGKRIFQETIDDARQRCASSLGRMPEEVKRITNPAKYPVEESEEVRKQADAVQRRLREKIERHGE